MSGEPMRFGMAIYLREEKREEYEQLHSQVSPLIRNLFSKCHFRNTVLYYCKELSVLFSHMEYTGDDVEADMKTIEENPLIRDWYKKCEPCERPIVDWKGPKPSEGGEGDWWTPLQELWHDGHHATSFKE